MRVEVLVSTMNQNDYSLIERMRIKSDAVIVNQCDVNDRTEFYNNGYSIIWINSTSRGLSVSRNICLEEARGDICLIADDDIEYIDNYVEIVSNAFSEESAADIIRFQVEGIEKKFKTYSQKKKRLNVLTSLRISSVEIAFRRLSVRNVRFDEMIGAGTDFYMGEENAFLMQCLQSNLIIYYIPQKISNLHILQSTWKNISTEKYLISRGAAFEAMNTPFTHLFIVQFALRKRYLFNKDYSLLSSIRIMEKGRTMYIAKKRELELKDSK